MVTLRFFTRGRELLLWCESAAPVYVPAKEKHAVEGGWGSQAVRSRELHRAAAVPSAPGLVTPPPPAPRLPACAGG